MRSRTPLALAALLGALAAAGCQDQPTGVDTAAPPAVPRQEQPQTRGDLKRIDRFQVELTATGPFRPGAPIRLTARVRAGLRTRAAQIAITLPEMRAAERTGWDEHFGIPGGERLEPSGAWTVALTAGQEAVRGATVTLPAPGVYRAVATAVADDEPGEAALVRNAAHQEIWLVVDEAGGRTAAQLGPALFPAGAIPEPGPFRARDRSLARHAHDDGPATGRTSPAERPRFSHDPQVSVTQGAVRVEYYHPHEKVFKPVPKATVYLEYWDRDIYDYYQEPILLTSDVQTTNAYGEFWVDCSLDSYYTDEVVYSGRVYLDNADVDLRHSASFSGRTVYDACVWYEYGPGHTTGVAADPGHAFNNMNQIIPASRSYFGMSRGKIRVTLGQYADNTSFYDTPDPFNDEEIALDYDDVWGTGGVFTQAHEYGHAFHEVALGIRTSDYCGEPHSLNEAINMKCAYFEGFADYHAVATMGAATGRLASFENNGYLGTNPDGSTVEGPVASFLLDLSDPANEAHDLVQYPGFYVAQVIKTCRVARYQGQGAYETPDGIDDLIYCYEQGVDFSIANSSFYFPTRANDADLIYETATEPASWNKTNIRRLWLKNLYNQ